MLIEETLQKLADMRMNGFLSGLRDQFDDDKRYRKLAFEERVGLLVDREWTDRQQRRLTRRLRQAKFRLPAACIEDIEYKQVRCLDRALIRRLGTSQWVANAQNITIEGKTGTGKSYLGCALGNKACRDGHTVLYRRFPRLLDELKLARGDGSYPKLLTKIAKTDVLIIDDWGIRPMTQDERRDILEIFEDRHGERSVIITSQLPVTKWHVYIGDATLADAIMDRIVHVAHKLKIKGPSMRKEKGRLE